VIPDQMIYESIAEAQRFILRAKETLAAREAYKLGDWTAKPINKNAAMKRASMDLTRSLAQLRRGRP
jgi:hypothetical protein